MPRTFQDFADAGFLSELLPIIPPDATIHPQSPAFANLSANKGKVPGKLHPGGWFGFSGWTDHTTTTADLPEWQESGASIGMQGRLFPCIDIDVDNRELADAIHHEVEFVLGPAPVRFGRGSRRVLLFAAEGLRKRRLAFQSKDPGLRTEKAQAVELLATGQHYVVEGIHPGTGKPYFWQDDISPTVKGAAGLGIITKEQINDLFDRLERLLGSRGYEVDNRFKGIGGSSRKVCQKSLLAPSLGAVERALAALQNEFGYDEWLAIGMAIKAACGPDQDGEAYALWEDWSLQWEPNTHDVVCDKWESMQAPFRVGWPFLASIADEEGDGSFFGAHEDFDAVAPTPTPEEMAAMAEAKPLRSLFKRWVWVERLKRVCDLETGDLFDREQFNVKNNHIGHPSSPTESAWATLVSNPRHLQRVTTVTYRPGADLFVQEGLPGLVGRCINRWRDPSPSLPEFASDEDVKRWLDHVAVVVPDEREREIVFDWLAWIVQNPGEKPNWCLVIGSSAEGIGKDLMLEPVRKALGAENVREIGPEDLNSDFTDYLANTRLLIVEEMQINERKAMQNKLKPLIAAPPHTLRVNVKYQPQYEIPNLVALIFFTNMDNALAMSRQDRRYFVVWNDDPPRSGDYFVALDKWYTAGGAAAAAQWLKTRDVSAFNAKGSAPMTRAKQNMRKATLPEADAMIVEAMERRDPPFHRRFIRLTDVVEFVASETHGFLRVTRQQVARKLKAAGALPLDRVSLGKTPVGITEPYRHDAKQMQLFALPGDLAALELRDDTAAFREAFWADWQAGQGTEDGEAIHDFSS